MELLPFDKAEEILRMHSLPPLRQVEIAIGRGERDAMRMILLVYFMTSKPQEEACVLADLCLERVRARPS